MHWPHKSKTLATKLTRRVRCPGFTRDPKWHVSGGAINSTHSLYPCP